MSQYLHDQWGPEQGFPSGTVSSLSQTPDGYLWIGSQAGLIRFDGWKFRVVLDGSGELDYRGVFGLITDREGNLWVEQSGPRVFQSHSGALTEMLPAVALMTVTAWAQTREGVLVAAVHDQGLIRYRGGKFESLVSSKAIDRSPITAVAETPDGTVWVGTRDAGLFRVSAGVASPVVAMRDVKVNSWLAGRKGELWIGTDHGLAECDGSGIKQVALGKSSTQCQTV